MVLAGSDPPADGGGLSGGDPMARFVRLTASVVMVTSGVWLGFAFLAGPGESEPAARRADSVEPSTTAVSRGPRLIPDPSLSQDAAEAESAEAAAALAPLLDLVTEPADTAPPPPLPAVPQEMTEYAPPLASAYRSALDLPPPPLLDAHAPPPLAGGSTWRQGATSGPLAATSPGESSPVTAGGSGAAAVAEPRTAMYAVRDGDDLTSIATRFYGHPSAARFVYEANRDRLPSSDLLPIGAILVLPPPPEMAGGPQRPGGWIEPGG